MITDVIVCAVCALLDSARRTGCNSQKDLDRKKRKHLSTGTPMQKSAHATRVQCKARGEAVGDGRRRSAVAMSAIVLICTSAVLITISEFPINPTIIHMTLDIRD